ncbi:hypothetical protein I79_020390 [Cricetulus griseus]|uniref:Uncharacterized protein n=1 Tax=Cricetulus griseus TaxID=10029 RepID=G3I9X9_CRIGR|nr:hypothetical protein I79_020390 [Cricetulus griseus]
MTNAFAGDDSISPNPIRCILAHLHFCQKNNKKVPNLVQHPQIFRDQIPGQDDREYSMLHVPSPDPHTCYPDALWGSIHAYIIHVL